VRGDLVTNEEGESSNFFHLTLTFAVVIKGGGGGNSALRVFCFIRTQGIDFTGAQKQKSSIKKTARTNFLLILMFLKKMESGESRKDGS